MRLASRHIVVFLALGGLTSASCRKDTPPRVTEATQKKPPGDTAIVTLTVSTEFLRELDSLAQVESGDTIHVYSAEPDPRWPLLGTQLSRVARMALRSVYQDTSDDGVFAAARLSLDSARIGYLLRVPSHYSSSRVDLWILDRGSRQLTGPLEVADWWGDAGEEDCIMSWLVDLNQDGTRELVSWAEHSYEEMSSEEDSMPKPDTSRIAYARDLADLRHLAVDSLTPTQRVLFLHPRWRRCGIAG